MITDVITIVYLCLLVLKLVVFREVFRWCSSEKPVMYMTVLLGTMSIAFRSESINGARLYAFEKVQNVLN